MIRRCKRWALASLAALVAATLGALANAAGPIQKAPVVIKCIVNEFTKRPHSKVVAGSGGFGWLGAFRAAAVVAVVAAMTAFTFAGFAAVAGILTAFPAAVTTRSLKDVLTDIKKIQDEHKGKPMPDDVAEKFEALAKEGAEMQAELDRDRKVRRIEEDADRIPDPLVPDDEEEQKDDFVFPRSRIAGYMHLGDFVLAQKSFQDFKANGSPKSQFVLARINDLHQPLVPLTNEEIKQILESPAAKATPTIGEGVIEPTRVPEIVRVTEHEALQLRDVLDTQRTTSDAIKYIRIVNYTRGAAAVAHSAQKPESALALDKRTEPVRTIAVWIPVEEQQLDDIPALAGIINGELLFDVNKHVEELVMYGDGEGEQFRGIMNDPAVLAARTVAGDTLIDIARRGVTDVRRAGFAPNGILVDPLDWEDIVLEKGSDNRYVWVVVTEGETQRLWGVPVIETVAMEDFQGHATERRNMVVGDFARGATLYDRMDATISVGWINDQFIRNQRTILAELRAAFALKRPGAFRRHETQAAVES